MARVPLTKNTNGIQSAKADEDQAEGEEVPLIKIVGWMM